MKVLLTSFLTLSALFIFSASNLFAQGQGIGAGKSLGALGKAASNAKASQATRGLTKATEATSRINRGFGSSAGGVQRASAAMNRVPNFQMQHTGQAGFAKNSQRILDHRLGQAEHLRAISARNGNEHLLETADRMEANAQRNYLRQNPGSLEVGADVDAEAGVSADAAGDVASDVDGEVAADANLEIGQDAGGEVSPSQQGTNFSAANVVPTEKVSKAPRGFWFRSR